MTTRGRILVATVIAIATSHVMCGSAWGDDYAQEPPVNLATPTTAAGVDAAPPLDAPSMAAPSTAAPSTTAPLTGPLVPGSGYLHLRSAAHVKTAGGSELDVAPGYYLDDPTWTKLDAEFKRLQDTETRLTTENKSLKTSMKGWEPGWRTLALTLAVGMGTGVYMAEKFLK